MAMRDLKYRDFQCRLMPTVPADTVIGVRTPELRRFAKAIFQTPTAERFLKELPHRYYEENNLHGFLIEGMRDYERVIAELDVFLPYVDNWATCDLMRSWVFRKHTVELLVKIKEWLGSEHTYTVRFGIEMLMTFYLDERFSAEYPELVCRIRSAEYYVNMMIAWYFATALAKQYDTVLPYIEQKRLSRWTHNKAIQKAIESYRISAEQKEYLRRLRIKD